MKVITMKTEIVLGGKKFRVGEVVNALKNLESKEICEFFVSNNIYVPRKVRMVALKSVLDPKLRDPEVKKNLTDEVNYRLNFYKSYTEQQLVNILSMIINDDIKAEYIEQLWLTLIKVQSEIKFTPEMIYDLYEKGLSKEGIEEDLVVFNDNLNQMFIDNDDQIDGIDIETFRKTLVKSSTLVELREIGKKFSIDVPRRIKKNQLADIIVDELQQKGEYTDEIGQRLSKMSVMSLQRFAKDNKIKASIELKKEDIIEYIIAQYDQDTTLRTVDLAILDEKTPEELDAEAKRLAQIEIDALNAEKAAELALTKAQADEEKQKMIEELEAARRALEAAQAETEAARNAAEEARLEAEEEAARRALAEGEAERIAKEKHELEQETLKRLLEEKPAAKEEPVQEEPVVQAAEDDNDVNEEVLRRLQAIQQQVDALAQEKEQIESLEEEIEETQDFEEEQVVEEAVEEVEEPVQNTTEEFEIPVFEEEQVVEEAVEEVEQPVFEEEFEEPVQEEVSEEPNFELPEYEDEENDLPENLEFEVPEETEVEKYTQVETPNEIEEGFEAPEFETPEFEQEEIDENFDEGDLEALRKRRNDDNEALKRRKVENDKDLERARKNDAKYSKKKKHGIVFKIVIAIIIILVVLVAAVVVIGLLGVFDVFAQGSSMYDFYMKLKNDIIGGVIGADNARGFYTWVKGILGR